MSWHRLLPFIDAVLEVADARLPQASRNPDLVSRIRGKGRILVLHKADLADVERGRQWLEFFRNREGLPAVLVSARGYGLAQLEQALVRLSRERPARRYIRPIRAVVVGIPNVGKSTLINRLVGRSAARTGALPGVTRGEQWLRIRPGLEILDTPGRLPLRPDLPPWQLAVLRAVSLGDDELEINAEELLAVVARLYPGRLPACYPGEDPPSLEHVARIRGLIGKGGLPDRTRAARAIWQDFWDGRWGRLTLELPPEV
ncbi:MAG: 50S ribosome-binding GTPase [Clostridia bacterium]|nr:50S ribosome-binding GTPase [Clostridia bacterium]MDH7572412.1 50S ribosome-binding GTPase [Clostridia bacterium]